MKPEDTKYFVVVRNFEIENIKNSDDWKEEKNWGNIALCIEMDKSFELNIETKFVRDIYGNKKYISGYMTHIHGKINLSGERYYYNIKLDFLFCLNHYFSLFNVYIIDKDTIYRLNNLSVTSREGGYLIDIQTSYETNKDFEYVFKNNIGISFLAPSYSINHLEARGKYSDLYELIHSQRSLEKNTLEY